MLAQSTARRCALLLLLGAVTACEQRPFSVEQPLQIEEGLGGSAATPDGGVAMHVADVPGQAPGVDADADSSRWQRPSRRSGDGSPSSPNDAGAPSVPEDPEAQSFHPLYDGAIYTYRHSVRVGDRLVPDDLETVEMRRTQFEGYPNAYLQQDPDRVGEGAESILVRDGSIVYRVYKREFDPLGGVAYDVHYSPGFPRFDDIWGVALQTAHFEYWRDSSLGTPDLREQDFEVLSLSESVTIDLGGHQQATYEDCVKVRRDRVTAADPHPTGPATSKLFWFARGVGKVREEHLDGRSAGNIEELIRFERTR